MKKHGYTFVMMVVCAILVLPLIAAMGQTPPPPPERPTTATAKTDVVGVLMHEGNFGTLLSGLKESEMEEFMKGPGPFTVFAPTDEAFNKIPQNSLDALRTRANRGRLLAILKMDVVRGNLTISEVAAAKELKTIGGATLRVSKMPPQANPAAPTKNETGVLINGAKILKSDIVATNGVVHVIDKVLLPAGETLGQGSGEAVAGSKPTR